MFNGNYHYAVLIGIIDNKIILTKRSDNLKSFAGHVCLPGGRFEVGDINLTNTAIREFSEEVMFNGNIVPLFCLTPEFSPTATSNLYPIIAKLDGDVQGFNLDEVQKLFYLDINDLSDTLFSINQEYPSIMHNLCFNYADEYVWGVTASILKKICMFKDVIYEK